MEACNAKIQWSDPCAPDSQMYNGIYEQTKEVPIHKIELLVPTVEETATILESSLGTKVLAYRKIRSIYRLYFKTTFENWESIMYIGMYEDILLTDDTNTYEIDPTSISISSDDAASYDYTKIVTLDFSLKYAYSTKRNCDCVTVAIQPYEECQNEGGSGNGNTDECDNVSIFIVTDDLPTLRVAIKNKIDGVNPSIQWYLNGAYIAQGSAITTNNSGSYSVRVQYPNCNVLTDSYTLLDQCNKYTLNTTLINYTISGQVDGLPTGQSASIEVIDEENNLLATSLPFTAKESGVYTVKATSDLCGEKQISYNIQIIEGQLCTHSVAIVKDGDNFTTNVTGNDSNDTINYNWVRIDEGNAQTQVGTSQTITPVETGYYKVTATIGECSSEDGALFIKKEEIKQIKIVNTCDEPVNTNICNIEETPTAQEIEVTIKADCDNPLPIIDCSPNTGEGKKLAGPC